MAAGCFCPGPEFYTWLVSVSPYGLLDDDGDVILDDYGIPVERDPTDDLTPLPPIVVVPPPVISDPPPPPTAPGQALTDDDGMLVMDDDGVLILDAY